MARGTARKQDHLPAEGMAPPSHPDIDEAALEYQAARDRRMAAGDVEETKYAALAEAMKRHGVTVYKFTTDDGDRLRVEEVATKVRIKVKKEKVDGESGGSDSGGD